MVLRNRINNKELKAKFERSQQDRITFSFYKYVLINDPQKFRDDFYRTGDSMGLYGRIYVSSEGINGQASILKENLRYFREWIDSMPEFAGMRFNFAIEDDGKSFYKLIIKTRSKIVADGIDDPAFNPTDLGKHLSALEFNTITQNPETIVLDMRNHYEFEVGHFENAIHPDADTFREALQKAETLLADKKDKPLVMYCTGGIRCEKASAYFKYKGFQEVYQLNGGIIQYARDIKAQNLDNKFRGKNFVFDERLGEKISEEIISKCHQCGKPADTHINCVNESCHLLFIQCDECKEKYHSCCSSECVERIQMPLEEQVVLRKGVNKGMQVFKKGRSTLDFAPLKN